MSKDLAAVCCHFNPCGYRKRIRNFHRFYDRARLAGIPLLVVELAFGERPFELSGVPGGHRIRGGAILWQKERLLQEGIDRLVDQGHRKIAWLDADIVFQDDAWSDRISAALERYEVVQCFAALGSPNEDHPLPSLVKARLEQNEYLQAAHGGAWAAREECLRELPLYQHCIVGGGDTAMADGFMQRPPNTVIFGSNPRLLDHYAAWHARAARATGFVRQAACLLEHGSREDRQHCTRHRRLDDFVPEEDIVVNQVGAFDWATEKPRLHRSVELYFDSRREDSHGRKQPA